MEIYIEYALLENFLVDGTLLFLAVKLSRQPCRKIRLFLSALLGAVFAVVFPLFPLQKELGAVIKFSFPLLLCAVAVGQKGRGRVALTAVLFYAFSFAFAGLLIGVLGALEVEYFLYGGGAVVTNFPIGALLAGLVFFAFSVAVFGKKLYSVKRAHSHLVPCVIKGDRGCVKTLGYEDTGNSAQYRGLPVCFVTPDIFYDACKGDWEQTKIKTLTGEKTVAVQKVELSVSGKTRGAYVAPSSGLMGREYKVLLPKGD